MSPQNRASEARPLNLTQQLLQRHSEGDLPAPGEGVDIRFEQTLTQDATGTLIMLLLDAIGLQTAQTKLSAQYVDHNLVQQDNKNPDDHRFLLSACRRFGLWYSRPGNGVSHPLHMAHFAVPGGSLIGADSHTPAAGGLCTLAVGAGGADVALAISGQTVQLPMPEVRGVELVGRLPDWVSAKDVILELLRRHGVAGGHGQIIEYFGPGVEQLSAMDRHVICNMGTELGATTSLFPSDDVTRRFLERRGRGNDWRPLLAEPGCDYDHHERIDLSRLQPLIACPSSPGKVVPVVEVAGKSIYQAYIGSSANPGYRDLAVAADMVAGKRVADGVSFDINPATREVLQDLIRDGRLNHLIAAGARLHQAGCNGCIGMGQAPATDSRSLRTVPRNFPGRSGTREDRVYLCSPETAAASALEGRITDPRSLGTAPERPAPPAPQPRQDLLIAPPADATDAELVMGPNILPLPEFPELPDRLELEVLLAMGDDVSTDEILPAGLRTLPYRSNIPGIARFSFDGVDEDYPARADEAGDHMVAAGSNYGQGSSREHAALAPRHLGLRVAVARSFARIHKQNLVNYGVLPLRWTDGDDLRPLEQGDVVSFDDLRDAIEQGSPVRARRKGDERNLPLALELSDRQRAVLRAGGLINWIREH